MVLIARVFGNVSATFRWRSMLETSIPFLLHYSATNDRHPGDVNHVLTQLATTEVHGKEPDTNFPSLHLDVKKTGLFAEGSMESVLWNV
jgi:hypothetical protein